MQHARACEWFRRARIHQNVCSACATRRRRRRPGLKSLRSLAGLVCGAASTTTLARSLACSTREHYFRDSAKYAVHAMPDEVCTTYMFRTPCSFVLRWPHRNAHTTRRLCSKNNFAFSCARHTTRRRRRRAGSRSVPLDPLKCNSSAKRTSRVRVHSIQPTVCMLCSPLVEYAELEHVLLLVPFVYACAYLMN